MFPMCLCGKILEYDYTQVVSIKIEKIESYPRSVSSQTEKNMNLIMICGDTDHGE